MTSLDRRAFLGGAAAGATLLATSPAPLGPALASALMPEDPRATALIELSRDPSGRAHVARVALLSAAGAKGSLPVTPTEQSELMQAMKQRDFAAFQQRGLRLGGQKYVFIREAEGGQVLHAVRRGELVTVRKLADGLVVATSQDGMAHGRAVEAVYQYAERFAAIS